MSEPASHAARVATPSDRETLITRTIRSPKRAVFDAWTDPKKIPLWCLGPPGWAMPVCEVDLRAGGKWHYMWRKGDGAEMDMVGTFREVSSPDRLVWTESWGPEWPETTNTLLLTEKDGVTVAAITMLYPTREARDAALKTGMADGMEQSFVRLEKLVQKTT